ncbi:MAG: YkgJ family cysteine cluster protein [Candidatus Pacearchaeota archaeon]|jgi:Fe-S-cluster containining protein
MNDFPKMFNRLKRDFKKLTNKNYIQDKINKRKGECKKCGQCCENCKFLDKTTNLCKVYETRPFYCHQEFPLDKTDQKIWKIKSCGYSFED